MRVSGVSMAGVLAVLAVSSAAGAQVAAGLEPGVHVDPGSPAAKEYALPLNQARRASGKGASRSSSGAAAFGAGIKPPGAGGSSQSGARGGSDTGSGRSRPPAAVLGAESSRAGSAGSGNSILALLAGGVVILVLGGFGGTILRRSHQPTPSA